jgi:lipopolysaccharide biosynthesis glycosyltransferase
MAYAYVFLCMKGDSYVPGVICAAESIRRSGSKYDIVCMVTDDVSDDAISTLKTISRVVNIKLLKFITLDMKTKRQMELYESWFNESYTKWNSLQLTEYEKILFVDADMLVIQNIDHLFNLPAPAATFSTPWAKEFDHTSTFDLAGYPTGHGDVVSHTTIKKSLSNGGYTFIASLVLLEPKKDSFTEFIKMMSTFETFGFNNYSTPDEQSLAYFYASQNINWTHIHQKYNFIVHKINWIRNHSKITVPHVLHYFSSKKPWLMTTDVIDSKYNTDKLWWYIFLKWYKNNSDKKIDMPILDLAKKSDLNIQLSKFDDKYFPWLQVFSVKFPGLFKK